MGRWWDTDMASASQALYTDPSMALDVSTTPDDAFTRNVMQYTRQQQEVDQQKVEQDRSGFLGTLAGWYSDADKFLSDTPVVRGIWGGTKAVASAVWYPIDKAAQGAHWLYSEAISQPISTLVLMYGNAVLQERDSVWFDGDEWSKSYGRAENISPGQAIFNTTSTLETQGAGPTSLITDAALGDRADSLREFMKPSDLQGDMDRRSYERLLYDTEYWRDRGGWTYTMGTGATDFAMVIGLDPTTYLTAGASSIVKGVRSIQLVDKGGELVRTQGKIIDTTKKLTGKSPQTAAELSTGEKMQDFFDWVAAPSEITGAGRKSAAEIEMHPIWGRGRRQNPFKAQYAQVLSKWDRGDMELGWRFMAGDNAAVAPLMERGQGILDDIGRISDNRVAIDSMKYDPEAIGYFAAIDALRPSTVPASVDLALPMTRETALQEEAGRFFSRVEGITEPSAMDKAKFDAWRSSKLSLIDNEFTRLEAADGNLRALLSANMGREVDDFSATVAHGFGGLSRSYRMGSGSFTSSYKDASRAYQNKMKDRRGRFVTEGKRAGFYGTPLRIVQSFNDKTPQGWVNHNDPDAGERVFEMLREVPGLTPEARISLHNRYMTAGDKVSKSQALQGINAEIIQHMATNVKNLDGEVARVISGLVETKVQDTVRKLLGTTGRTYVPGKQAFSGAEREGVQGAGRRVDHVEDGEGWVVAPLAKTQLSQADTLLPIREIERALDRASGSMQRIRQAGGSAVDATRIAADSMNGIWKAATLLRPAYVPRMVSEEVALAAVKFGFMSRILMDGGKGAKNWAQNRVTQVQALRGKGSYTPSTGSLEDSVIRIEDPQVLAAARARRTDLYKELAKTSDPLKRQTIKGEIDALKVSKIRVSNALPVVTARIKMENELLQNLKSDLADYQRRYAKTQAALRRPPSLGSGPGTPAWTRMGNNLTRYQDHIDDLTMRIGDHEAVIKEFTDYHNEIYRVAVGAEGKRLGTGDFEVPGYGRVPQAFSGAWDNPIQRSQISSHTAMSTIYARAESIDMQRMIQSGTWTYIAPDAPNHMQSWVHAVNYQFGQDELFIKVMEDPTGAAAEAWLKTPDGKQHLRDLGIRARNPSQLIEDIGLTLDKYLPEDSGLRQKLINGENVTEADLVSKISRADYPTVHGEEILEKTALHAKETAGNIVDRVIEKGFKRLGSIPSDVLSRHPTYLHFQEGRFKELMSRELSYRASVGKHGGLEPSDLNKMLEESDKLARKDMSKLVYDPNRTTATEALRFIAPFFSAHADSLARWGGMIAERPKMVGRAAQIYNAPVSANMVTDQYGNPVGKDGYADIIDPSTGEKIGREFVSIDKRVLHFRAPWSKKSEGSFPVKLQAMNTILPGDPWWNSGSGPLIQVAGSQLAKASPQTGDFLQWAKILPYGPTDTSTALVPKYMRAMWDAYKGDDPDNEEYQKAYLAIWNKKQAEYLETGQEFSQKDIENEAKNFLYLNILEAWGSPAQSSNSPLTGSPYQFFVDQLAQMRKVDPENYRDKFLAKFGTDYGGFSASLSKSMGIAASVSADAMADKYRDEIAADPDMAQFWVGNVYNGGPFSQSVYQKQLDDNYGSRKAREKITAEEAIERSQTERGWYEYRTGKGALDSLLIRNGFRSYSQKGAEGYNQAKKQLQAALAAKYPAWSDAFMTTDKAAVPNRIRSFEMAVQDERLMSDPMRYEMAPLGEYLIGRRQFKAMLNERGASKLSYDVSGRPTGQNADIGMAWEQFKMGLINQNVAFGDLHNRYLNNDDLQ